MECIKCKNSGNEPVIYCDGCERSIHADCSGLNQSELKVMNLRSKRNLKFYCEECLLGVRLVPQLIKKIDDLQVELEDLKTQVKSMQAAAPNCNVSPNTQKLVPEEDIMNEMCERQKRLCNVMIFNMPEKGNEELDKEETRILIEQITKEDLPIVNCLRVGKKNKNGYRALKIVLSNAENATKIIKSDKSAIKGKKVFITVDLTAKQRANLQELRQEVERRSQKGEDVIIKYTNGVPRIVTKN